jgi:hypothetical protein
LHSSIAPTLSTPAASRPAPDGPVERAGDA